MSIRTFVAVFAFPPVQASLSPIGVARVVAKGVISDSTKGGTVFRVIVRVAVNAKAYRYDASILGVEGAQLPVNAGNGKFILHHKSIET